MIRKLFNNILSFFPIQLLLLHLKKSHFQLFIWIFLFLIVSGTVAGKYGIPFLFLSPEYLDQVNIWSYIILGLAFGLFVISFHISCYVRFSFRYPFLATLSRAFFKFSLNNSIIPLIFIIYFIYKVIDHHITVSSTSPFEIFLLVLGFLLGSALMISLCLSYFFTTNRGIVKGLEKRLDTPLKLIIKKSKRSMPMFGDSSKSPKTYLRSWFQLTRVRRSDHYRKERLLDVFQQHHRNASFFTLLIIILILVLSWFRETSAFMLPSASTIFILASVFMLLTGALFTWFKGWTTTAILIVIISINGISSDFSFRQLNFAYGLDYQTEPAIFDYDNLNQLTQLDTLMKDKQHMLHILENWKLKNAGQGKKPKLILINTSGGGLRSAVWTFDVLQFADSLTGGNFFDASHLITGSSGGMVGAAYYRELAARHDNNSNYSLYNDSLRAPLTRDLLNPVTFAFAVNDLFIRLKKYRDGKYVYQKDRGYAWEKELSDNTGFWQNERLRDYADAEFKSEIPLMILAPSMINEGRRLLISPQPVSYLSLVYPFKGEKHSHSYDGVEFSRLFKNQDAGNLKFSSALRMSASFPIITPLVSLPSDPPIRTIDAGVRDNSGFELSLRFLYYFKEWIRENTSGVVFVQIQADKPAEIEIDNPEKFTIVDNYTQPLLGVYNSFINMQAFQQEYLKQLMNEWFDQPTEFIHFQLLDQSTELSLSWHLTELEKQRIYNSIYNPGNWDSFKRLKEILE